MDHLSDADLKAFALGMWANHIETGSATMSAADARNQLDNVRRTPAEIRALGFTVKSLTPEQAQLVIRLRTLASSVQAEQTLAEGQPDAAFKRVRPRFGG